jgi:hypothetical protein
LLFASFGNPNPVEGERCNLECHHDNLKDAQQSGDSAAESQHFLLKGGRIHVEYVDGDHRCSGLLQPTSCSRTWEAVLDGKAKIASGLDQLAQPMIVLLLNSK